MRANKYSRQEGSNLQPQASGACALPIAPSMPACTQPTGGLEPPTSGVVNLRASIAPRQLYTASSAFALEARCAGLAAALVAPPPSGGAAGPTTSVNVKDCATSEPAANADHKKILKGWRYEIEKALRRDATDETKTDSEWLDYISGTPTTGDQLKKLLEKNCISNTKSISKKAMVQKLVDKLQSYEDNTHLPAHVF